MNTQLNQDSQPVSKNFLVAFIESWNQFFFGKASPRLLGLMRICAGLLVVYTFYSYTYDLTPFFGAKGWYNLELRKKVSLESPMTLPMENWTSQDVVRAKPPFQNKDDETYFKNYVSRWGKAPPMPYPKDQAEADWINSFISFWGLDPRNVYRLGSPDWSIWFHVTSPNSQLAVHMFFIAASICFTIGFCTRISAAITWFAALSYAHRATVVLFGVDTMMMILLLYLMIGPSGAALSVDRCIQVWWQKNRSKWVQWWYSLFGKSVALESIETGEMSSDKTPPSTVLANFTIRLLQLHICFIYASAGLAKLKGATWWTGTAVWGTLANFEFAPMESEWYFWVIKSLVENYWFLQMFLAAGTYFTLLFEIPYPFLIWSRKTRWIMLGMAVVLHGVIGVFMGLKTFALMMLVMNMAFLTPTLVDKIIKFFTGFLPVDDPNSTAIQGDSEKANDSNKPADVAKPAWGRRRQTA